MFKVLTVVAMIVTATPALADGHHGGGGHGGGGFHGEGGGGHHGGGGGWVGPAIGGAIGLGILGGVLAYAPTPYQPYYRWDCDPYGRCAWVWR